MAFIEDLGVFLSDFGVCASTASGSKGQVLLDEPDAEIFDGAQVKGEKVITYIVADFPDLKPDQKITIDNAEWRIRGEPVRIEDGRFAKAGLKR